MQNLTPEQYKQKYGEKGAWATQISGRDKEPSLFGRITNTLKTAADKEADIFTSPTTYGQIPRKATEAVATAFNTIPQVAVDVLPKPARQAVDFVGNKTGQALSFLADKLGSTQLAQDFITKHPEAANTLGEITGTLSNTGQIAGDVLAVTQGVKSTQKTADLTKQGVQRVASTAKQTASNVYDTAAQVGSDLRDRTQLLVAKKNVNPQLEASSKRLFLDGTKSLDNPVATYDKYLTQSKQALTDIKVDPAISKVGENMGNAFEQVIKQRSAVGKVLGEELKANGKIKISIAEPKFSLLAELKDSGLSYNPKTKSLTSFQGSKFVPQEVQMLNNFVKGVNALGDNPTVAQIDSFITKTRTALNFTKGESGVMGTTNAERIINGGIAKLKESLNPQINGNQALGRYWNANSTYSDLSDFIEEGSGFLGKKTLSGDFAKDASVAKSSVQSILNQGKKDFMVKLEELTGYKAIDDSVLALQAMADAGDFRGLSLLQAMSESGIPTSKAGFTQKILDLAMKKGGEVIAGTPEEQTRAFLQSLLKNDQAASPITTAPTVKASTGAKTSRTNQKSKINIKGSVTKLLEDVKKAQNGPDGQAGFVSFGGRLTKSIDEPTKLEIQDAIRYVKDKKPFDQKMEEQIGVLAEKYGITDTKLSTTIKKFEKLLENTKTTESAVGRDPKVNRVVKKK